MGLAQARPNDVATETGTVLCRLDGYTTESYLSYLLYESHLLYYATLPLSKLDVFILSTNILYSTTNVEHTHHHIIVSLL